MNAESLRGRHGWERLRVASMIRDDQRATYVAGALAGALLAMSIVPPSWFDWSGHVTLGGQNYSTHAAAILSVLAVIVAVRFMAQAVADTRLDRGVSALIGAALLVVGTDSLRTFFEQAVARQFWRPDRILHGDFGRILPLTVLLIAFLIDLILTIASFLVIVTSALPRSIFGPKVKQRIVTVARTSCRRMVDTSMGIVVIHVLGAYVLTDPLLRSLGQAEPGLGGTVDATALKTVFFAGWLHLQNLGIVEYMTALWAALALAQLVVSLVPDSVGSINSPTRRIGLARVSFVVGTVLVGAALELGRDHANLPNFRLLWREIGSKRLGADLEHWARHSAGFLGVPESGISNTFVVIAAALTAGAGLMGCTFISATIAQDVEEDRLRQGKSAGMLGHAGVKLLLPVAVPCLILCLPMISAVRRIFIGAPLTLVNFITDRHDPISFYAALHTSPVAGAITPAHLLTGTLMVIGLLGIMSMVFDSARSAGFSVGLTCVSSAIVITSGGRIDMLLAFSAGFVIMAPIVVWNSDRVTDTTHLTARVSIAVAMVVGLMLLYHLSPDLPSGPLVLGSIALQFGLFAQQLNDVARTRPRAVRASYTLPLVTASVALAAHQSNHWFRAGAYNSAAQTVALPFVTLPLVVVLVLASRSSPDSSPRSPNYSSAEMAS